MLKVCIGLLFSVCFINTAFAEKRIALVIGNSDYQVAKLKNPVHDATDISKQLEQANFRVTTLLNADQRSMKIAIRQFNQAITDTGTIGLFYFAGHGIQSNNRNYLIPIGAEIANESEVEFEAIDAGRVLAGMEQAGNGLNLVILDACRNNPFARTFRDTKNGLAKMNAPKGSLILYATSPGDVAQDGKGRNGVFTQHLLTSMQQPGLAVEQVFKKTAVAVSGATGKTQVPWVEGVILGDFYFHGSQPSVPSKTTQPPQTDTDAIFWHSLDHSDSAQLKLYLEQYPNGQFVRLANIKLSKSNKTPANVHTLTIRSNVHDDAVFINGKPYGKTKLAVDLPSGKHTIRIEKSGYSTFEQQVNLDSPLTIRGVLKTISQPNKAPYGMIGVHIQDVTKAQADVLKVDKPLGVHVQNLIPNSPAKKAGILPGDIILLFNEQPIRYSAQLRSAVRQLTRQVVLSESRAAVVPTVTVTILRNNKILSIPIRVGSSKDSKGQRHAMIGTHIQDLTPELLKQVNSTLSYGALVAKVNPNSPAQKAGIESGDIIVLFNGHIVEHASKLTSLVRQVNVASKVRALVLRKGRYHDLFINVELMNRQ